MHDVHHAWVGATITAIPEAYRTQGTDVLHIVRDRLGIDDARDMQAQALQKPFALPKRTFVIITNDIAVEAQNALLKLFEEPPFHAQFFVIKPDTLELLPTLSSRLMKLDASSSQAEEDHFASFLTASYKERLLLVAEKTKVKDTKWIESIVTGCEKKASDEKLQNLMENVVFVRSYMKTRGASLKMLLESLSLSLPLQ